MADIKRNYNKDLAELTVNTDFPQLPVPKTALPLLLSSFTPIPLPDAAYQASTTLIGLASISDGTPLGSITDGTQTVTFDTILTKETVGAYWSTWSSPPFSESSAPPILVSGGASLALSLALPSSIFGFELEPDPFGPHDFTADFYSGATLVGSIAQTVDGNAGARLFAASTDGSFDRVVITGTVDFAIAQVRYDALAYRGIDFFECTEK